MDPKMLGLGFELIRSLMGSGNKETTRAIIQEELRKSQTQENTNILRQMLSSLEQKHAADLQEINSEKERYKLEVEFLRKELQEAKRDKKAEEKTVKMKEILTHLAELSLQKDQALAKNQKEKVDSPQSCSFQSNYTGGTLPWMDSPKGKYQSTPRGGGRHDKRTNNQNFTSNQNLQHQSKFHRNSNFQQQQFPPKQNMQGYANFQQQHFPPKQNMQGYANFQHHQQFFPDQNKQQNAHFNQGYVNFQQQQHFLPDQHVQQNADFKYNRNMPQNPDYHQKQNFPSYQNVEQSPHVPLQNNLLQKTQNTEFQQKANFQHSRGQKSNRYRGRSRGQEGNRRGRSTSAVRDHSQRSNLNQESIDGEPSTSFHIQVTKVGNRWKSSENISCSSDASSQRGKQSYHGRGRGRGRGNIHQGMDGAQSMVKKNRRKNQQTEPDASQKQNKEKNNEGDPEDNCTVS